MGRQEEQGGLGPEELLREGKPDAAVAALQRRVRSEPANPKLRVFLFQFLCVLGDWERARAQLKTLGELDAGSLPLVHLYGAAITCELLRREVFAGARTPVMLGEPLVLGQAPLMARPSTGLRTPTRAWAPYARR